MQKYANTYNKCQMHLHQAMSCRAANISRGLQSHLHTLGALLSCWAQAPTSAVVVTWSVASRGPVDSVDGVMVVRVRSTMMSHTLELEAGEVSRAGRGRSQHN